MHINNKTLINKTTTTERPYLHRIYTTYTKYPFYSTLEAYPTIQKWNNLQNMQLTGEITAHNVWEEIIVITILYEGYPRTSPTCGGGSAKFKLSITKNMVFHSNNLIGT